MASLAEQLRYVLKPVRAGDKIADVITKRWITALQNCILMISQGHNVKTSGGIYKREATGGFSLYGKNGSAGIETSTASHPFKVSLMGSTKTSATLKVEVDSWLMQDEQWDSKVTITGLGAEFTLTDPEEVVWLQVNVDPSGAVTSATIEHGVPADPLIWESFPDPIEFDDPLSASRVQQVYYHLLAYMRPSTEVSAIYEEWPVIGFDSGDRQLVSTTRNNLILCPKCSSATGELVYVVAPWFTPYYGT